MSSKYGPLIQSSQITFDIRKYAASSTLGSFARDRMEVHTQELPELASLMLTISADILARKLANDRYESSQQVPRDWWQHLVQDHFPAWYRRKWPVRTRTIAFTIELERLALYPQADIVVPKNVGQVVIQDIVRPWTGYLDEPTDVNPSIYRGTL